MAYIMGGIALTVSMIALWMAVEARSSSKNETSEFVKACIRPLQQDLEALTTQLEQLAQSHNRLIKAQATSSQQVEVLKQKLLTPTPPKEEKKKIREPFS